MPKPIKNVTLVNDSDKMPFKIPYPAMIHPLLASPERHGLGTHVVPAWLDSPMNKVRVKKAFLDIMMP
jgi:hypothetical protein